MRSSVGTLRSAMHFVSWGRLATAMPSWLYRLGPERTGLQSLLIPHHASRVARHQYPGDWLPNQSSRDISLQDCNVLAVLIAHRNQAASRIDAELPRVAAARWPELHEHQAAIVHKPKGGQRV